jgi:type II secretory pathway pseudopilin PulG
LDCLEWISQFETNSAPNLLISLKLLILGQSLTDKGGVKTLPRTNQKGVSLPEALMGALILSIALGGLGVSIQQYSQAKEKTELVSQTISVESRLLSALSNADNYTPEIREALTQAGSGNLPSFNVRLPAESGEIMIPSNGTFFLSRNGEACTGFSDENCWFRIDVTFGRGPNGLGYSYNITPNDSIKTKLPEDSQSLLAINGTDAYQAKIPADFVRSSTTATCATDATITGMDRDTGAVQCLTLPTPSDNCPDGSFARGLRVDGSRLVLDCRPVTQELSCPTNYSLRAFSTVQLAQGFKSGTCLWVAQDSENRGSFAGGSIVGEVCPPHYHVTNQCSLQVLTSQSGYCQKTCYTSGSPGNPSATPPVPPTPPTPYDCSYALPAVAGSLIDNTATGNGQREVNCSVTTPTQLADPGDCDDFTPAVWEAQATFTANCQIDSTVVKEVPAQ